MKINNIQVDSIGLFPKSRSAFPHLDYVVILDKLIKVDQINYKPKNFFEQAFIKIVNSQLLK